MSLKVTPRWSRWRPNHYKIERYNCRAATDQRIQDIFWDKHVSVTSMLKGSGCGSVGKAVASDNRGPRFKPSHRRSFYWALLIVSCVEKTKIKKKRPGMAHFKKNCPLGLNLTRIHNRLLIYNHPCCSSRPEACTAAPTSSSTRLRRDCCSKGGLWWERRSGDGFGRVLQFSFQSCWSLQLSWPLVYTSPTAGRPLS